MMKVKAIHGVRMRSRVFLDPAERLVATSKRLSIGCVSPSRDCGRWLETRIIGPGGGHARGTVSYAHRDQSNVFGAMPTCSLFLEFEDPRCVILLLPRHLPNEGDVAGGCG